jgi:hypothetical protein
MPSKPKKVLQNGGWQAQARRHHPTPGIRMIVTRTTNYHLPERSPPLCASRELSGERPAVPNEHIAF